MHFTLFLFMRNDNLRVIKAKLIVLDRQGGPGDTPIHVNLGRFGQLALIAFAGSILPGIFRHMGLATDLTLQISRT